MMMIKRMRSAFKIGAIGFGQTKAYTIARGLVKFGPAVVKYHSPISWQPVRMASHTGASNPINPGKYYKLYYIFH